MYVIAKTKSINLVTRRVTRQRNYSNKFKSNNNQYYNGDNHNHNGPSLPAGWSIYHHNQNQNQAGNYTNNERISAQGFIPPTLSTTTTNIINIRTSNNNIQSDRQQQSDHSLNHQYQHQHQRQHQRPFDNSGGSAAATAGLSSSSRLFDSSKRPLSINTRHRLQQQQQQESKDSAISRGVNHNDQQQQQNLVTVTEIECTVENVYPLPELTIYQVLGGNNNNNGGIGGSIGDGHRPRSLERARVQQNSTQLSNGAFRVSMILSIDDEDLLMLSTSNTDNNNNNNNNNDV